MVFNIPDMNKIIADAKANALGQQQANAQAQAQADAQANLQASMKAAAAEERALAQQQRKQKDWAPLALGIVVVGGAVYLLLRRK